MSENLHNLYEVTLNDVLGTWMYNRRKALKMSLQAVADAAGTSKSYVWDLERGVHVPTLTVLVGIAKALEIDLSALIKELEVIVYGTI